MLTEQETVVLNLTRDLWNAIKALPELHASDLPESMRDIHDIQHRIMARPAYRQQYADADAKP